MQHEYPQVVSSLKAARGRPTVFSGIRTQTKDVPWFGVVGRRSFSFVAGHEWPEADSPRKAEIKCA
ncbi:MAG TPA: hypothetical protein VNX22_06950 [Acidobacteriaceae bacterium]|nr:hypothetical protein [Acidobacteriaceae bacterium]